MLITLNPKQRAICIALLERSGAVPAKDLAGRHGISLRSVRYHLETVRTALKGTGLLLEARPHQGVWIEGPPDRREAVVQLLAGGDQPVALQPADRAERILLELLSRDGGIPLDDLAGQLGCSRSTLLRDLPTVAQRLNSFGLRLRRPRGRLQAEGAERDRREAMVQLLVQGAEPNKLLASLQQGTAGGAPETDLFGFFAGLIRQSEGRLERRFTDESFASMAVHLTVALQRMKEGRVMTLPARRMAEMKQFPEWPVAAAMATQIAAATGVALPDAEVAYLVLHLAGGRSQPLAPTAPEERPAPDPRVTALVERFTDLAEEALQVTFAGDAILRDGLTWHLQGLLQRQRVGARVTNPLMAEIRTSMDRVYTAAEQIAARLRPEFGFDLPPDEVGFLTIHLAAALERQGQPPGQRVLVVCSTGLGSAQLLAARLMRLFKNLHVVGVVSALDTAGWQHQADLVITTVPLPPLPVRQVRVSPLLTGEEAERVDRALRGASTPEAPGEPAYPSLDHLITLIAAHAEIRDPAGLRDDLLEYLVRERPPLELVEPILREVGLLGISLDTRTQQGLAIHMQMALPRFRAGQVVHEPQLDRFRQHHRSLFQAVLRGLQLIGRWHGVPIPEAEVVPILRYILQANEGDE